MWDDCDYFGDIRASAGYSPTAAREEWMGTSVDEISQHAGVGRSTAYRVLSDDPRVSPEARERVMRAIEKLGYPAMRPRSRRRSGLVLWLPGLQPAAGGPYVAEVVEAIERAVDGRRGGLRIISRRLPDSPGDVPVSLLRENIEGMLTVAFYSNRHLEALGKRWPVVSLLSSRQVPGVVSIGPDYAGGARLAVEHLLERGHRRIALVTGDVQERNFSRLFLDGYAGAMTKGGLGVDAALVHSHSDNVGKGAELQLELPGRRAARELMGAEQRATAIIARHDSLVGIMRTLREMGFRVPEDVSIVGCGAGGLRQAFGVKLTTVSFDAEAMAALGLELIKAVPAAGARVFVPVELREGDSVLRIEGAGR
jgi:DNA-binding LacI/PurR family transcriptional regulator